MARTARAPAPAARVQAQGVARLDPALVLAVPVLALDLVRAALVLVLALAAALVLVLVLALAAVPALVLVRAAAPPSRSISRGGWTKPVSSSSMTAPSRIRRRWSSRRSKRTRWRGRAT